MAQTLALLLMTAMVPFSAMGLVVSHNWGNLNVKTSLKKPLILWQFQNKQISRPLGYMRFVARGEKGARDQDVLGNLNQVSF